MAQKTNPTFNVLNEVCSLAEKLHRSQLKPQKTAAFSKSVKRLGEYFGTEEHATWMLCALLAHHFNERSDYNTFSDIANFFDCTTMQVLPYRNAVEELLHKRYITNLQSHDERKLSLKNDFHLSEDLLQCLLQNKRLVIRARTARTAIDMMREIADLNKCYSEDLFDNIIRVENKFAKERFIRQTRMLLPRSCPDNDRLRVLFYVCCSDCLMGSTTQLPKMILRFYTYDINKAAEFMAEANALFTHDLIEFAEKESFDDSELTITKKAKEMLFGKNAQLFVDMKRNVSVIQPESIDKKELFYEAENEQALSRLRLSLQEENFRRIQEQLGAKGMKKSLTVLLYGAPGTGKTESVSQIARATGRKILHVDISSTKSCWFGESEKLIKKLFQDYHRLYESSMKEAGGRAPILLFNEADGILSRRKNVESGHVTQTENAMQNIILEEMEWLEGIMIATTNLASNLDKAFERRFLFKIKFEAPSVQVQKQIWRSRIDWLTDAELDSFAKSYNLSGGQIDNIVRKATMEEILNGKHVECEALHNLCREERMDGEAKKIGFF